MIDSSQFISALTSPLLTLWQTIVDNALGIIAAAAVVCIGYLIGHALGWLLSKALEKSKLDENIEKIHLHDALGFIKFHALLGTLLKWYVVSLFIAASVPLISSASLAAMIQGFAFWLPSFLAGVLIFAIALVFAEVVHQHLTNAKTKGLRLVAEGVKIVFIIIGGLIALDQMQVQIQLASNIVLIIVGGFALAIALAVGIGGGLALKDEAHAWLKNLHKK
ncbi:MAG: hypothetical protein EPN86_01965 [Nanoarchaeota archaeon]|nr:MAG: hypothetical protein EPN86_01965 [Nanoarchaeota archaeon]